MSPWTSPVGRTEKRMAGVELAGRVVVVPVDWEGATALATKLASKGATVVLVGPDGTAAGRLAAVVEAAGSGRPAIFVHDGSDGAHDALVAFVSELFRA